MSDKSNQQISNLMDGELEVSASQFILKRMAADDSLSATWKHYHLVKACLQKPVTEPLIDVAHLVTQQLRSESKQVQPTTQQVEKSKMHTWLKPIMGLTIAASVAFMSVTLLQNQQTTIIEPNTVNNVIADVANVTHVESVNPILQTHINATTAASETNLIPPPYLSRYPSVSSQSVGLNQLQNPYQDKQVPYIIFINKSIDGNYQRPLSPIRSQEISD